MIISNKIWIGAIFKGIWKILFLVILVSAVSYLIFDLFIKVSHLLSKHMISINYDLTPCAMC